MARTDQSEEEKMNLMWLCQVLKGPANHLGWVTKAVTAIPSKGMMWNEFTHLEELLNKLRVLLREPGGK